MSTTNHTIPVGAKVRVKITANDIRDAVMQHWLSTGQAATVKVIASAVGASESTVRKITDRPETLVDLIWTTAYVERKDRSYGAAIAPAPARALLPRDSYLRRTINTLRTATLCSPDCVKEA